MPRFKNEQGINRITMTIPISYIGKITMAPIGGVFKVNFVPGEIIPDYIELQSIIRQKIDNKVLLAEDAVARMVQILDEYHPDFLSVDLEIKGAMHFDVIINGGSLIREVAGEMDPKKKKKEKDRGLSEQGDDLVNGDGQG